jgi:hypothetical protein
MTVGSLCVASAPAFAEAFGCKLDRTLAPAEKKTQETPSLPVYALRMDGLQGTGGFARTLELA